MPLISRNPFSLKQIHNQKKQLVLFLCLLKYFTKKKTVYETATELGSLNTILQLISACCAAYIS